MSAHYAPLPTQQSSRDVDRELNDAFESDADDDEDYIERSPSNRPHAETLADPPKSTPGSTTIPGIYDFERNYDYDRPPPGSPPQLLATALPNDIGNSNGELPTSPLGTTLPRPSFLRRAVGAILPTHYVRVPTDEPPAGVRGGGIQNDGVFSNVVVKPASSVSVPIQTDDGSIYMVPEDTQNNAPPSYATAQADAVPPYWDTIIHAPSGMDSDAGMIVGDLPSGSILAFISNLFVSFFFQFIGFLLTYLLHTTHAAKYGSRAGLGLTLIQYGFYSRSAADAMRPTADGNGVPDVLMLSAPPSSSSLAPMPQDTNTNTIVLNMSSREWLSFLLMTLGWFLLLSSLVGFWRVKNWESAIRASSAHEPQSPEDIARDIAARRNIEQAFDIAPLEETTTQQEHAEADLRAAHLL
ncbi:uncharacterized protein HD556DRAFT_1429019 [Suillus plorans]|uniref:Metal homeostatis protein bsd2 n=1 Tax=Suillus plorans TaxID=116603 RepID=A0A9P7DWD3_9AGAM|nr:uncharacterized protein HD556DRAFT_1429019 [Suillus plorans]KAG1804844.1 hypothetical protein HD556DRAFT_1429019 [Suillus plorans]